MFYQTAKRLIFSNDVFPEGRASWNCNTENLYSKFTIFSDFFVIKVIFVFPLKYSVSFLANILLILTPLIPHFTITPLLMVIDYQRRLSLV